MKNTQPSGMRQLQDTPMAIHGSDRRVAPRFRVQFRTERTSYKGWEYFVIC
jgi:hypothetical protein